jgi:hypothetical protein
MARKLTYRQKRWRRRKKSMDGQIHWRAEHRAAEMVRDLNIRQEWGTREMLHLQAKVASQEATIYRLKEELKGFDKWLPPRKVT